MNFKVLGILVVLLSIGRLSHGCTCYFTDFKEAFCSAQVVVRARIISGNVGSMDENSFTNLAQYNVKQMEIFKGSIEMPEVKNIYTVGSTYLCGFQPRTNYLYDDYVLFGRIHKSDGILVRLCEPNKPWKQVTVIEKTILADAYPGVCN